MNISFNENVKRITINNDPQRILIVNVSDFGILSRIADAEKKANGMLQKVEAAENSTDFEGTAGILKQYDEILREMFDEIFYKGASDVVFGKQNLLSVASGRTILENFFEAFTENMKPEFEAAAKALDDRVEKYKSNYDRLPAG